MSKKFLLCEPDFPISTKSKNHKNFLPIGLLKIASYLRSKNYEIKLVRGIPKNTEQLNDIQLFNPQEIWITSLFTYWSKFVKDSVSYYKGIFPLAKIVVGGIYATLMREHCIEYTHCDKAHLGIFKEAENFFPAYDLVDVDYQIVHTTRGCTRKCQFCGTYILEPEFQEKKSIKDEIKKNKLIFYDNNFLANRYINDILEELINIRVNNKVVISECQSGFDGRILTKDLAIKLKAARFKNPRIAWDNSFDDYKKIKTQINYLKNAGYNSKEIYIFMIYNFKYTFKEMELKRKKCWNWGVQIADCRNRPLNQTFDNYNPFVMNQTNDDYYIHPLWTDEEVKTFRKNVRRQNICIRHCFSFYSSILEHKGIKDIVKKIKNIKTLKEKLKFAKENNIDYWLPWL